MHKKKLNIVDSGIVQKSPSKKQKAKPGSASDKPDLENISQSLFVSNKVIPKQVNQLSPSKSSAFPFVEGSDLVEKLENARTTEELVEILKQFNHFGIKTKITVKGIDAIIQTMKKAIIGSCGVDALQLAITLLASFAENNAKNRSVIAKKEGIEAILGAVKAHGSSENLQEQTCRVLGNLAINEDVAVKIAKLGGIEAILGAMIAYPNREALQQYACGAIGNLANFDNLAAKITELGGIEAILAAMKAHGSSENLQGGAYRALMSLVMNQDVAIKIAKLGGIEAILRAMEAYPKSQILQ